MFIEYGERRKAFKLLEREAHTVAVSRVVVFDETA